MKILTACLMGAAIAAASTALAKHTAGPDAGLSDAGSWVMATDYRLLVECLPAAPADAGSPYLRAEDVHHNLLRCYPADGGW